MTTTFPKPKIRRPNDPTARVIAGIGQNSRETRRNAARRVVRVSPKAALPGVASGAVTGVCRGWPGRLGGVSDGHARQLLQGSPLARPEALNAGRFFLGQGLMDN